MKRFLILFVIVIMLLPAVIIAENESSEKKPLILSPLLIPVPSPVMKITNVQQISRSLGVMIHEGWYKINLEGLVVYLPFQKARRLVPLLEEMDKALPKEKIISPKMNIPAIYGMFNGNRTSIQFSLKISDTGTKYIQTVMVAGNELVEFSLNEEKLRKFVGAISRTKQLREDFLDSEENGKFSLDHLELLNKINEVNVYILER